MSPRTDVDREVDLGWWREADGRKARLTWRAADRALVLFHAGSNDLETLVTDVDEQDCRELVDETYARGETTVLAVRDAVDQRWPF